MPVANASITRDVKVPAYFADWREFSMLTSVAVSCLLQIATSSIFPGNGLCTEKLLWLDPIQIGTLVRLLKFTALAPVAQDLPFKNAVTLSLLSRVTTM